MNQLIVLTVFIVGVKVIFEVSNRLTFSSFDDLNEEERIIFLNSKEAIEYSHTLEPLISGQTSVVFSIIGF